MIRRQGNQPPKGPTDMDTKTVAAALNTDPKVLRRFLRDPRSTFSAVGSGARYEFTEADIPELSRRFSDWAGTKPAKPAVVRTVPTVSQRQLDEAVWEEEGPVVIEDIRDPRVRARVKAVAQERARRLDERLLAAGLHISQHRYAA